MSDHTEVEELRTLGKKYLNQKGQDDIEKRILDDRLDLVKAYLLGAIEGLHARQEISTAEATKVIKILNLSPEERARISTKNKLQ